MDGDLPGLPELRVAHDEDPLGQVHVVPVEADGFPDPHPGHVQQADNRREGRPTKGRGELSGRGHQPEDLLGRVQVGGGPVAPIWKEVRWGDLGAFVEQGEVFGEAAYDGEPTGEPALACTHREGRPRERELGGDGLGAGRLAVGDELVEQAPRTVELEPERAPQGEVVLQCGTKRVSHRATPSGSPAGQGLASARSEERSTFA